MQTQSPAATPTPVLTASEAARAIAAAQSFRRPKSVELVVGGRMPLNITRGHYLVLDALGLIHYAVEGAVAEVRLTERGREASQDWRLVCRGSYDNADIWHVPIGTRTFIEVKSIAVPTGGTATVEFAWSWEPTAVGEALALSTDPRTGSARFEHAAGRWRLVEQGRDGLRTALKRSEASQ